MVTYKVTFEGESLTSEDDKSVIFSEVSTTVPIPEDFMPKMFEYLESDFPYDVLYQIKSIAKDQKSLDSKPFASVIAEYTTGSKGGLLLHDKDGSLELIGVWDISDCATFVNDIYSKPESFAFVVVTISESMAP